MNRMVKVVVVAAGFLSALADLRVAESGRDDFEPPPDDADGDVDSHDDDIDHEDCCTEKGLCGGRAASTSECCAYRSGSPMCFVKGTWQCCAQPRGGIPGIDLVLCPEKDVVCGSDDTSYCNGAHILEWACEKKIVGLRARHKGSCKDSSKYNKTLSWPKRRRRPSRRDKRGATPSECCTKQAHCSYNKRDLCCSYRSAIPMVYHDRQWNCYNSTYANGRECRDEDIICGTDHRTYCNGESMLSAACVLNDRDLNIKSRGDCRGPPPTCHAK